MQYGNLSEVKHEMSHYSLINPTRTVRPVTPLAEKWLCVYVCVFLPLPPLPLAFHSNCHSPPFPQVQGDLQEIILLIKLWKRVQKP